MVEVIRRRRKKKSEVSTVEKSTQLPEGRVEHECQTESREESCGPVCSGEVDNSAISLIRDLRKVRTTEPTQKVIFLSTSQCERVYALSDKLTTSKQTRTTPVSIYDQIVNDGISVVESEEHELANISPIRRVNPPNSSARHNQSNSSRLE